MKEQAIQKMSIVAALCAIMLVIATACSCAGNQASTQESTQEATVEKSTPAITIEPSGLDNFTDESSPVVGHLVSTTIAEGAEPAIDTYHAFSATDVSNKTAWEIDLEAGSYTLSFTSPINADGSLYRVEDTYTVAVDDTGAVTVEKNMDAGDPEKVNAADPTFEAVPADQVTAEDIQKVLTDLERAAAKGDDTITGDSGAAAVQKATDNAKKATNVTEDEVQEAEAAATEQASTEAASGNATATYNNSGSSGTQTSSTGSSGNTSSNSSSGANSSSGHWETVHHDAVTTTEQVWVPNVVTKYRDVTTYEQQYVGQIYVCYDCGQEWSSDHAFTYGHGSGGHSKFIYESVPVTTQEAYTVDEGYYETRTVVIQAAYDEQVWVAD